MKKKNALSEKDRLKNADLINEILSKNSLLQIRGGDDIPLPELPPPYAESTYYRVTHKIL